MDVIAHVVVILIRDIVRCFNDGFIYIIMGTSIVFVLMIIHRRYRRRSLSSLSLLHYDYRYHYEHSLSLSLSLSLLILPLNIDTIIINTIIIIITEKMNEMNYRLQSVLILLLRRLIPPSAKI